MRNGSHSRPGRRVASDLFDSAAAEGARQSRSAKQQLDYWARVGREVTFHQSAARRRIERVLTGDAPMSGLTDDERLVLNAEIDAEIDVRMASTDFGATLDARAAWPGDVARQFISSM